MCMREIVLGRPDGLRARLLQRLGLRRAKAADPAPAPERRPQDPAAAHAPPPPGEKALTLKKEPPRDVTPPEGYEVVLHKDALAPGKIIEVIIGGTAIAVARLEGGWHAVQNACPHADGPLGEGTVEGNCVTCPYHGWQFDLTDGACKTNPYATIKTYPVQIVGDAVCVKL